VQEMQELLEILKIRDIKNQYVFDQSIIRGLAYYTGTVFEANLVDLDEKISVGGGGRYDNLAETFTDKNFCGVGSSVGLSRLFDLLDKNGLLQFSKTTTSSLAIIPLNNTIKECLALSKTLIKSGISNEVLYFDKPFKSKLNYANKKRIPFITVVGEDEIQSNLYSLKNMETGESIKTDSRGLIELLGGKVE
jgi:histidyl-tRNA synthetase